MAILVGGYLPVGVSEVGVGGVAENNRYVSGWGPYMVRSGYYLLLFGPLQETRYLREWVICLSNPRGELSR